MCKTNLRLSNDAQVEAKEKNESDEEYMDLSNWPEDNGGSWVELIYRRWTFSYMNHVLKKGSRQVYDNGTHLSQEDLFWVPQSMQARTLLEKFRIQYEHQKAKKHRLILTLWHVAAPTFIPAGFCMLITVVCQVSLPLVVRGLLKILEEHPGQKVISQGMPFAIALFIALFFNAFGNHRHRHLAMKSGIAMRASVVNIIYEHALHLTPKGRLGLTSGEVTNLIAVDTQKLYEVAQDGHLVWALPLTMIIVTICLLLIMGPTTLIGVTVLILFVPLVERITSRMLLIRQKRAKLTDKRVAIVNAMLQGIKVTKVNNYEKNYETRVLQVRKDELNLLRKELAVWALTLVVTVTTPVIASAATFAIYVLVSEENILTASRTFSVLLLFSALRFPINYAGRLIGKATQAYSAVKRISSFLDRELRQLDSHSEVLVDPTERSGSKCFSLRGASFFVGTPDSQNRKKDPIQLSATVDDGKEQQELGEASDIPSVSGSVGFKVRASDVSLSKGEVLAICGPVGAGKSILINGIIGEVEAVHSTQVKVPPSIAYVPQSPFIMNTTLRENILFGLPFEREVYERVLDVCCLRPDIEQLGAARDLTEIGERGVTLSGGQKQRVALARAAYARADLVLLDDPLSALDAGTSKAVFERLIKSPNAYFSNTAVVLVTHANYFLNRVDRIMIMVDGESKFQGTWSELAGFECEDSKTFDFVEHVRQSVQEDAVGTVDAEFFEENAVEQKNAKETKGLLMTVEDREHGLSSLSTWLLWFRRAGGVYFLFFQVLFMTIDRFAYVAVEYWLAQWTQGAYESITVLGVHFDAQIEGRSAQYKYLLVYSLILLVSVSGTILRSEWGVTGGSRAARTVFERMLQRVLGAPLSYFESTPTGRILNRFTYDVDIVDVLLTQVMSMFMISTSWYVAGVVIMSTILPWVVLVIFPVTVAYWFLMLYYRKSGTDLQRLDALSRSPIQAMVAEGLDGSSSIRVFKKEATFSDRFFKAADANSSALLNFVSAQRWLGVRIELLGSIVVLVSSILVISMNNVLMLNPGIVGLLIIWSSNFTITLSFLVDTFSDTEAAITAIERVDAMASLPQEATMETRDVDLPQSWPESGCVEFDNVCLRYRDGLPLALNQLSFAIPGGTTCGIVGRTGAGKSSLTVALFRLVEIESGQIRLDGVDLRNIGLNDVRGRRKGMEIIPQDPFLTGATLRECLDPFGESKDQDIIDSLEAVRLTHKLDSVDPLGTAIEEGGMNFSVGERQLLNLARALLSKPKVLVLDEATASIDGETDAFIQKMLRTRFKSTTLITIAHRLNTIMDYDNILVMDAGRAAEFGPPADLLEMDGIFAELVNATGAEGSAALRALAKQK